MQCSSSHDSGTACRGEAPHQAADGLVPVLRAVLRPRGTAVQGARHRGLSRQPALRWPQQELRAGEKLDVTFSKNIYLKKNYMKNQTTTFNKGYILYNRNLKMSVFESVFVLFI